MTKIKVIRNFGRENGNFFRKKRHSEILVREKLFPSPQLGARSPPPVVSTLLLGPPLVTASAYGTTAWLVKT